MNFLPFLFSFLLLFSIGFSLSAKRSEATAFISYGSKTLFNAFHSASSENASSQFRKATKNKDMPYPRKREEPSPAKTYFRDKKCTLESQKFNLNTLIKNKNSKFLYDTALSLLHKLYCRAPFYKPHLLKEILDIIIAKGIEDLDALFRGNATLEPIFYHMRQGTSTYVLETSDGYPSLWDYFSIESSKNKKMSLGKLSAPVLEAMLGPELFKQVRTLEMNENKSIPLGQLKILLDTPSSQWNSLDIAPFLTNTSKKDSHATAFLDEESNLFIRY